MRTKNIIGFRLLDILGRFFVTLCVISAGFAGDAIAQQKEPPTSCARICISIFDDRTRVESAFGPEQEPGAGKSVIVHAVASAPCVLLVAALKQGDGQLAYGWRPQYRRLSDAWEEVTLPENAGVWQWEKQASVSMIGIPGCWYFEVDPRSHEFR